MKNVLKWFLLIGTTCVAATIATAVIIAATYDVQKLKPRIEKIIAAETGRPVFIRGDLKFTIFPWVGLTLFDLHIGNPAVFKEKNFLTLKSFEARLKFWPLVFRKVQIKRFNIKSPQIVLVREKNGLTNWQQTHRTGKKKLPERERKSTAVHEPQTEDEFLENIYIKSLSAESLSITDATVLWIDRTRNLERKFYNLAITCTDVSLKRTFPLDLQCRLGPYKLHAKGVIGPLSHLFTSNYLPMQLYITSLQHLQIKLDGRIDDIFRRPKFDFALQVAPFSPRKLLAVFNQVFPFAAADTKTFNRLALKANIKGSSDEIVLSDGTLKIDTSNLDFYFKARNSEHAGFTFDISADSIDLNRYLPVHDAKKGIGKQKKPDLSLLKQIEVSGKIRIKTFKIGPNSIRNLNLTTTGNNERYMIRIDGMDLFDGKGAAVFRVDLSRASPRIKLQGSLLGLESGLVAKAFNNRKRVSGRLDLYADVSAGGWSAADWSRSLDGDVTARAEDLKLYWLDLDRLLSQYEETQSFGFLDIGSFFIIGPFGPLLTRVYENLGVARGFQKGESTIKNLMSDWQISNGIASARDVAFSTLKNRIAVSGKINIPAERFDNINVALIDRDGCAKFSQTINGLFYSPEIEKARFVAKHLVGPLQSLLEKAKRLTGSGCNVFYSGSVPHPLQ